jgi:transposase
LEPGSCREDPVFGILERGGKVRVEVVQNVTGETLLYMMIMNVNRSGVIYTNKFRIITDSTPLGFVI